MGECCFLCIVISSEVEKSSWQTDKRRARKQRKASLRRRLRRSASVMYTAVQERSRAPLGMTIQGKTYFSKRASGPRLALLGSPFQRKGLAWGEKRCSSHIVSFPCIVHRKKDTSRRGVKYPEESGTAAFTLPSSYQGSISARSTGRQGRRRLHRRSRCM